jgi:hypothetical protein
MIRRTFRVGLRLGALAGIAVAVVKTLQGRRDSRALAAAPASRWAAPAPLADVVDAGTMVAGSADVELAQVPSAPEKRSEERPRTWVEPTGAVCPSSHPVKAKMASGLFHLRGMANYSRTRPDRCYASEEAALADGLTKSKR